MSNTNMTYGTTPSQPTRDEPEGTFYGKVMLWATGALASSAFGTAFLGPLVPQSLMIPLYILMLITLLGVGFLRRARGVLAPVLTIAVPLVLGIILYPTLNYYITSGAGDVVTNALLGTGIIFGSMSIIAWRSPKSLERFAGWAFAALIGIIVLSLVNVFLLHLTILQLLISFGVLILFSVLTWIDIQRVRDRVDSDNPAFHALSLFLDFLNIFVALLNIFGIMRD